MFFLVWNTFEDDDAPLKEIVRVRHIEEIFREPFHSKLRALNWRHDGDCWSSEPTTHGKENGTYAIFHEDIWLG